MENLIKKLKEFSTRVDLKERFDFMFNFDTDLFNIKEKEQLT
ncbi:MAG: hypothetical protein ACJAUH_001617, partial [Saprospiraceae bacterium]